MSDLAISLLSGSTATVVVAVVVWLVVNKILGLSSDNADLRYKALTAAMSLDSKSVELQAEKVAREHWEAMYVSATASAAKATREAVSVVSDASAVSMAGGDSGGLLMEPDWKNNPGPGSDPSPAPVLPTDKPPAAGG